MIIYRRILPKMRNISDENCRETQNTSVVFNNFSEIHIVQEIMWKNKVESQFGHEIVQCATDLEHLYRIYSIPTHDKNQWLLLQFIVLLMMDAKGVRNMQSIPSVVNKHNTARVAACSFIIASCSSVHLGAFSLKVLVIFSAPLIVGIFSIKNSNLIYDPMIHIRQHRHQDTLKQVCQHRR